MYEIGDRVRYIARGRTGNEVSYEETGVIIGFSSKSQLISVRWDEYRHSRHSCGGKCTSGHGWIVVDEDIELIDDFKMKF